MCAFGNTFVLMCGEPSFVYFAPMPLKKTKNKTNPSSSSYRLNIRATHLGEGKF